MIVVKEIPTEFGWDLPVGTTFTYNEWARRWEGENPITKRPIYAGPQTFNDPIYREDVSEEMNS
jgi:hypothetical protein